MKAPHRSLWMAGTALAWLALALLLTWPLAANPTSQLIGTPGLEAVDHLWALWAAANDGPLVIHTDRVHFPDGYDWVLADPANLLFFAPGWALGGPALGYHLVLLGNLLLAGLAAAVLARVWARDAAPWWVPSLAGIAAIALAPLSANLFTGMTEALTMGLAALAVAALCHAHRRSTLATTALAGLALGLSAWGGPYTALYTLLAGGPLVLAALLQRGGLGVSKRLAHLLMLLLPAILLALPVALAVLGERAEGLPGSESITAVVLQEPNAPQNRMLGADLVGVFLPIGTSPGADLHVVYLGMAMVLLAILGLRRVRWPIVLLCGTPLLVMGLGFYLQAGGQVIMLGENILMLPAGGLSIAIEALGRAPRWYRAIGLLGILLAPVAAHGAAALAHKLPRSVRPLAPAGAALVLVLDPLLLGGLPFPRDQFHAAPPAGYAELSGEGALIEVPHVRYSSVVAGRTMTASGGAERRIQDPIRHPSLLWQTFHGRALGGNPHQAERTKSPRRTTRLADQLLEAARTQDQPQAAQITGELAGLGFGWVLHHPDAEKAFQEDHLRALLGPPAVDTEALLAWPIRAD